MQILRATVHALTIAVWKQPQNNSNFHVEVCCKVRNVESRHWWKWCADMPIYAQFILYILYLLLYFAINNVVFQYRVQNVI